MIGATQVLGGGGVVVATSINGNREYGQIDLDFAPGAGNAVNVGGNYTLQAPGGQWRTVCTSHEGDLYHFREM
jgi:hypothetical protein